MAVTNTRPKLNLKYAYERVKSAIEGLIKDVDKLDPIAKNSAGNGIYNGKMTISQRGDYTSATAATTDTYYLDRWKVSFATVTANIQDMGGSLKITATSSGTGLIQCYQPIENYATYAGKTITVSAKITSNTQYARLRTADGVVATESTPHSGNGEEELITLTVKVSDTATKLDIQVITYDGATVALTSGDYIEFTDVRLDLGEHRLSGDREYAEELALCKRYYQEVSIILMATNAYGAVRLDSAQDWPVEMRVAPTMTASGLTYVNSSGYTDNGTDAKTWRAYFTAAGAGLAYLSAGKITASAEL